MTASPQPDHDESNHLEPNRDHTATIQLRFTTASLLRAVLVAGAMYVAFVAAGRATDALWWFAQAALFAALAYLPVRHLSRHMPTFVAILGLTFAVIAVIGATIGLGLTELQAESIRFRNSIPPAMRELEQTDGIGYLARELHVADAIEEFADNTVDTLRFKDLDVTGLAKKVAEDLSISFIIWVLTVMLIFTGPSMYRGVLGQLPERSRPGIDSLVRGAYHRCATYVGLTSARAAVLFIVVFGLAELLGLDMPGLLAAFAALAAFMPYIGIVIASLPVALMALISGPVGAPIILAVGIVLQVLDVLFVQRYIDRRAIAVGLFPTVAAAMVGLALRGPGGALLGVGILTMVMAVVQTAGSFQIQTAPSPDDADGEQDASSAAGDIPDPAGAEAAAVASAEGVHDQ